MSLHKPLIAWYRHQGRYHLPWKKNKTAYRVWLSEVMLQQTQVETVIDYFNKFIKRFPTVSALAKAPLDDVLALWSGLGYYQRARNLHKCAQTIHQQYNNRFPKSTEGLMALPGIGRSTANAILSLTFDMPVAILDGNVKRVLSRYYEVYGNAYNKAVEKRLWALAESSMDKNNAASYTQAIMDLGATVCKRSKPLCQQCPLSDDCLAFKKNLTNILPEKKIKAKIPTKETTFVIIANEANQILLERRPDKGLWGGLWVPPQLSSCKKTLEKKYLCKLAQKPFKSFRHTFTHFHLEMSFIHARAESQTDKTKPSPSWFDYHSLEKIGLPKPIQKTLTEVFAAALFS